MAKPQLGSPSPFQLVSMDTLVVIKAFAISLIVTSHAFRIDGLYGGLNVLLLISGISMATFAFAGTTLQTLEAFKRYVLRIAVPAVMIVLFCMIAKWEFNWQELALISNWVTRERIGVLPIGYVMMITQLLAILGACFWLLDLTPKIRENPLRMSAIMLAIAVVIALIARSLWDTKHLNDNLPHLYAWSFIMGWFYWALLIKGERTLRNRLIMTLCCWCVGMPSS